MKRKTCIVITGPSYREAEEEMERALPYADLFELRLDQFKTIDVEALKGLRSRFKLPMIFTLRGRDDEGAYALQPEYIDIEWGSPLPNEGQIILSYHDFEKTPDDLEAIWREMQKTPAHLYKMAFMAKSTLDMLRLLVWAPKNVLAISMGPFGELSRQMCLPFTYVSLSNPILGQLRVDQLLPYDSETALYGLIGDPVSQSPSHKTHNALFQACHLNAIYVKMVVRPSELPEFITLAKKLPFRGLSVTMPLKEAIVPLVETDLPAVNTLLFVDGKVKGYNTDGLGAVRALEKRTTIPGKTIALIGAGGAAQAIAASLIEAGARVTLHNRTLSRAQAVAKRLHCEAKGLPVDAPYDLVINTTPVPMPDTLDISVRTPFGYEMFAQQALGQFAIWNITIDNNINYF